MLVVCMAALSFITSHKYITLLLYYWNAPVINHFIMKYLLLIMSFTIFLACNHQRTDYSSLQVKIDSLQIRLANTYKPGFGEFMSGITPVQQRGF